MHQNYLQNLLARFCLYIVVGWFFFYSCFIQQLINNSLIFRLILIVSVLSGVYIELYKFTDNLFVEALDLDILQSKILSFDRRNSINCDSEN